MTKPPKVDSAFWQDNHYREAFASRHIGKLIRSFRTDPRFKSIYGATGISQTVMGGWLGMTQAQVSRLENGPAYQNLDGMVHWARTLNVPASVLWFDLPGHSRSDLMPSSGKVQVFEIVEDAIMEAADESARLLAWAESGSIGDLTVEQINDELAWIAKNYLRVPTAPLFDRTRLLRDQIFELLSRCKRPSRMLELYSAAGWGLSLLAWMSIDIGASHAAMSHLRTAWLCADNADRNDLRAWVRACQHTAHFWEDDFERAAYFAEDGLRYATSGSSELFLSSALALDAARAGDADKAYGALDLARRSADKVLVGRDFLSGPFTCSIARASGFWADIYLSLGDADTSLNDATESVRRFEQTDTSARNLGSERMARCQAVKAHLILGELDGAQEALTPVLETEPENRVRPLLRRVSEISKMTMSLPMRDAKPIAGIREAIVDFKDSSRVKELQAGAEEIE